MMDTYSLISIPLATVVAISLLPLHPLLIFDLSSFTSRLFRLAEMTAD
jgi:hypothetical protein